MRLKRVMIYVNDLARIATFYSEALGLGAVAVAPEARYVEFDAGGCAFGLHAIPEEYREPDSGEPRESCALKFTFAVGDVGAVCARVVAQGGRVVERPWGSRDGIDPEGNIFGIEPE